jgi:hypothetical protein
MPPPVAAALRLKVVFVTVADAALSRPPPSPDTAVLSFSIFSDSVRMPATFAMAPPLVAMFPVMMVRAMLAVPPFQRAPPVVVVIGAIAKLSETRGPTGAVLIDSVAPTAL